MKVVFLDVDGVLISEQSMKKLGCADRPDPACVERLNRITDATGAKIVVSSTWRFFSDIDAILWAWGITATVIGKTGRGKTRGAEINAWLRETEFQIDRWVILDDDSQLGKLLGGAVVTDWKMGLTDGDAQAAIKRLMA